MSKLNELKEERTAKLIAFEKQLQSGRLKTNMAKVLEYLKQRPSNIYFMERRLQIKYSTLTATLSLLEDLGLVTKTVLLKVNGSTLSQFVFVEGEEKQAHFARERHLEKYKAWLKRGKIEFGDFTEPYEFDI